MENLVDPEEIAFGSVDDDVAEGVARSMGYRGWSNVIPQEPVRLPEFGPRKIHSTPEIVIDPLMDDVPPSAATMISTLIPLGTNVRVTSGQIVINGVAVSVPMGGTVVFGGVTLTLTKGSNGQYVIDYTTAPASAPNAPGPPPLPKKPQWVRKFYENRPTERPKVGRPKRKRA